MLIDHPYQIVVVSSVERNIVPFLQVEFPQEKQCPADL